MSRRRPQPARRPADWQFFTFPVAFAFTIGLLVAPFLYLLLGDIVVWIALFGVSFGSAHIIGHTVRRRGLDKQMERAEEEERERRALAARDAAALEGEAASTRRRRRRRT